MAEMIIKVPNEIHKMMIMAYDAAQDHSLYDFKVWLEYYQKNSDILIQVTNHNPEKLYSDYTRS